MRISLIEPDAMRRSVFRRHLRSLGHQVTEEDMDRESATHDRAGAPSAVIVDLSSEDRPITQALPSLRKRFPKASSILLLREEQSISAKQALACGVQAMLREPFRLEELELHLAFCGPHRNRRARRERCE